MAPRFQITYNNGSCLPLELPKDGRFDMEHRGERFENVGRDFVIRAIFQAERPAIINLYDRASECYDGDGPDRRGRGAA